MSELTDVPISYPDTGNLNYFEVEDDSFWFKFRNEVILSTIKEYIPVTQPRILDVGGGNGYVAKMLQQNSYDVHLCEPGPGAKNAKLRGLRHVYNCMLDQVDGGSSFNILGFFDVVEHIENPKVLLQSAKAHLKHDGYIILTVPCFDSLWSQDDIEAGHFRRYSRATLCSELRLSGYEIIYGRYFFGFLLPIIFLLRRIPFLLKGKKSSVSQQKIAKDHKTSKFVFNLLNMIFKCEEFFFRRFPAFSIGSSFIVIAKRTEAT